MDAAKIIAARFNVKHTVYTIPENSDGLKDFELKKKLSITMMDIYIAYAIMKCVNGFTLNKFCLMMWN